MQEYGGITNFKNKAIEICKKNYLDPDVQLAENENTVWNLMRLSMEL